MMYKPRVQVLLDVPKFGSREEFVTLQPRVIEAKWTKNNHLIADELTISIGWTEGGVDPRFMRNARIGFWLWDQSREDFDINAHLRFTGVCIKAARRLHEVGWVVDMTFHDYTTLFIHNKPMKTTGMPEYSDTLQAVWEKICDNTGWQDPSNGKILSSVEALRDKLRFARPDLAEKTLGDLVPKRFHAIAKPTPKKDASSWDVWQWCVGALGLISYIEKDECIVTDSTEHYKAKNAALCVYGRNIHSLEEEVDASITTKGILLKSFDPLAGRVIEAFYPPPGDDRLKARRAAVRPKSEGGTSVTANEQSADYEEFNMYSVTDQAALDKAAADAYEERKRQEMQGSFKTSEMLLEGRDENTFDVFDLRAGDAISIEMEPTVDRETLFSLPDVDSRRRYLVNYCDYDEDVARLIATNLEAQELASTIFHVKSIELEIGAEKFDVEIKFHNLITID